MPSRGRIAWAFLALSVGIVAAIFLPSPVAGCLGPLGVTAIQCASATGIMPSVGPGAPALGASLLLAALIGVPGSARAWSRRVLFAVTGAALGLAAYLVLRPTTWTGPISTGEVITLQLPLDVGALALAALLGATGGLIVAWVMHSMRSAPRETAA